MIAVYIMLSTIIILLAVLIAITILLSGIVMASAVKQDSLKKGIDDLYSLIGSLVNSTK